MTPKQRQLAAIRREPVDRIPVDAIWAYNQEEIARYLDINKNQVLDYLGFDGRTVLLAYAQEFSKKSVDPDAATWSTTLFNEDISQYGTTRKYPLAHMTTVKEIESFQWPDPNLYRYEKAEEMVLRNGDHYALRGPFWVPVFCKACDLFGMEEAMVKMMIEPAVFEAAIERITELIVETCERFLKVCGDKMEIFYIGDDFATQKGMMISPAKWREFIKPRISRIIEVGKRHNKIIWFHSCGDITSVLPDLIDMGIDLWETVQLHTLPMSPRKLKEEYGRHIAFFGGVNSQKLPFASPAEIEKEVKECIRILGKGSGYICGPDHSINADVSPENTIALYKTATSCPLP